jgi:hypothetical protein
MKRRFTMRLLRLRSCWLLIVICSVLFCSNPVQSAVDIEYSHDVKGTGTVITDYRMDDQKSSQASGRIRGTGSVMNKYVFLSENDSENITVRDQFVLSQEPASVKLSLADFPMRPMGPASFRLMGTSWAAEIQVPVNNQSSSSKIEPPDFRIDSNQLGLEANQTFTTVHT